MQKSDNYAFGAQLSQISSDTLAHKPASYAKPPWSLCFEFSTKVLPVPRIVAQMVVRSGQAACLAAVQAAAPQPCHTAEI